MKKILIIFFFSAILLSNTSENFKNEYEELQKNIEQMLIKDSTNYGMQKALRLEYKELNKLWNKYYKQIMITSNEKQITQLKDSQREWLKVRNKEIEFYTSFSSSMENTMLGIEVM